MISRLNEIIDENLENEQFSIDFLCRELGMSRASLHRKIKESSGLSTSLFIRKRRLLNAKKLIEETDLSFSEVSYATGINNPQNFSKYFQEEYGLTPSQYKKSLTNQSVGESSVDQESEDNVLLNEKEETPSVSTKEGKYMYLAGAIMIAVVVAFIFFSGLESKSTAADSESMIAAPKIKSIAVLPFQNLGSPDETFFSDGIMEDILLNLARIDSLKVISRTSSMLYRNTEKSLKEIAQELNVYYILEGSVRQYEGQIRINVQLINAADDSPIWVENYDRSKEDIFVIQSEVSKEIALALEQNLSDELKADFDRVPTNDISAYNDFILGRELIYSRTEQGLSEGIRYMENALKTDPQFADALAFMALGHMLRGNLNYVSRQEIYDLSIELANKALAIDPFNDIAYLAMACNLEGQHRWDEAVSSFKKAFEINPNNALAYYWYSLMLREIGELQEATAYSGKAVELDPLQSIIIGGHIVNCAYSGDYGQAEEYIEKGRVLFDNSFLYFWGNAKYEEIRDNCKTAIEFYDKALTLNHGVKSIIRAKYYCMAKLGMRDEALQFITRSNRESPLDMIDIATVYCGLGDADHCVEYLLNAAKQNVIPDDILVDPKYALVRHEPGFQAILQSIGLNNSLLKK